VNPDAGAQPGEQSPADGSATLTETAGAGVGMAVSGGNWLRADSTTSFSLPPYSLPACNTTVAARAAGPRVVANGTIEATRLALESLSVGDTRFGSPRLGNLMAHLRSNITVRIKCTALGLPGPRRTWRPPLSWSAAPPVRGQTGAATTSRWSRPRSARSTRSRTCSSRSRTSTPSRTSAPTGKTRTGSCSSSAASGQLGHQQPGTVPQHH
jgi:hypothetical protein